MTTVNLELSRQLHKRWPEWDKESAEYVYYINGGEYSGEVYQKNMVFDKDGNLPARTLDELRVFALELIEKKQMQVKLTRLYKQDFKDALIQGCDSTASWILKTFGGK